MFGKVSKVLTIFSLFVVVVVISFVVNLPLNWVLNQPQVKQKIPKNIVLSKSEGVWWDGKFHVELNLAAEKIQLGEITYQLSWADLLLANLSADIQWQPRGKADGMLQARVETGGEILTVSQLTGDIAVSTLMQLSEKTAILSDAEGELHLLELGFVIPIKEAWPTSINGKLAITQFSAMGAEFGLLEVTPALKGQEIKTLITGGQKSKGWELKANTLLLKNHRYEYDVKVTATNPNNMPDWVALMLPMKNPKLATLKKSGRW